MAANDADDYVKAGKVLESSAGDKFEVGRKIGGGQFGQVYDAKHQKKNGEIDGIVALKMVKYGEDDDSEVMREIDNLNLVRDVENIIELKTVFDFDADDDHFKVLVFEKFGPSLEHLIKDRILCIANCIKIADTLLEIFEKFQKLGLCYKDLHSGNLLFCPELFHLKLTDFGLSEMSKRNAHKDPKAWKYVYDASSVALLMVCCRTDQKVITKPECSLADYSNEMRALKESLLESGMMFLLDFVKELISQLKGGEVSYPQLRRALSASQFTPPNKFFILTSSVPVMLA
ncbi:hypothetical protein B9Z55_027526 [Caenorhabditis nigoni]|uniref:Protein kinase domain-containing protein n=1 Tax=Caenorhabditis nigoni TaxID=1611254 RepID=A0A2G5SF42_9PELO|nr:hypothetical protein B9Z55_027526 [Caenorhabditis nigoni]